MKTIIQVEQEPQLNVSVEESTENILVNVFQSPDINIEVSGIVYGDSNVDLSNYWTKTESDSKYKPIGYVPTWNSITGKPIFFSGNYNDLTNKPTLFNGTWASLSGKPTTIAGYGITDAFDGNYDSLSNKPTSFPPSIHTHEISDINNLQVSLENKLDKPTSDGTYLVKKTGDIISYEIFSSVDLSNYYTKTETYSQTEINGFLSGKQNTIGYIPENVSNKSDSYTASSSTTFASTKALVDGLENKLDKGTYTGTAQDLYTNDQNLENSKQKKVTVIPITGNTTLSEIHNGAILHITNSCKLTFAANLGKDFNFVEKAFGSIIVQHVAASGVTLNSDSGLILKNGAMGSVYAPSNDNFILTGTYTTS